MGVDTTITDGQGTSNKLNVTSEGAIPVVLQIHPPVQQTIVPIPYRSLFTDSAGSEDMAVNGVVTPVEFTIEARDDLDIYVKTISVEISDNGSPALNKFGAITALANGVEWSFFNQSNGTLILHQGLQTNLDFVRLGVNTAGIGDGTNAFLADVSGGGTAKSYLPNIDMSLSFGMTWGLRLVKGSKDKLTFKVKDDLTSLVRFDAIAYGILV